MGSSTVRAFVDILSLVSHTMGGTPVLIRGERWGLDVKDWFGKVDVLLAQDAGQHLPAHRIRIGHRAFEQLNQRIPEVDPVLTMGPFCAAGHASVYQFSGVKYVQVHTCSRLYFLGNVSETDWIRFRRFLTRHAILQDV